MPGIHRDIQQTLRRPWARIVMALAAVGFVVIVAMGGFREAKSVQQALPQVSAGQTASSDAFEITPLCAWVTDRLPGRQHPDGSKRFLVLQARVVNRMEMDWTGALEKDIVWPADSSGAAASAQWILHGDDHSLFPQLPPKLPAQVELVWPLTTDAAPVGRWGLYQRSRIRRHLDSGENMWMQQSPQALMVLPISAACPQVGP